MNSRICPRVKIRLNFRSRLVPFQDGSLHPNSCWPDHWEHIRATWSSQGHYLRRNPKFTSRVWNSMLKTLETEIGFSTAFRPKLMDKHNAWSRLLRLCWGTAWKIITMSGSSTYQISSLPTTRCWKVSILTGLGKKPWFADIYRPCAE